MSFTTEKVQAAVDSILETLQEGTSSLHSEALAAFKSGNHDRVKRLASTNLADSYCRSLGYLGSALKLTPNTDTILAEAARAAADFAKERELHRLSQAIHTALN
ncbi:hypothetical protein [Alkalinema sp. FACHB-956]|uniref:hypothetical protein n=1 Tax=Alkalinema sp. FACHB-956 TaxID=2692768 RepID=UPI00168966E6|nr:hypothetical protein [Alkalinema sp. FACHB-956]MBD2329668.1 hypothetical protein [Alkalinema sp. FACHB-956]